MDKTKLLLQKLIAKGMTLATAESCTGGLLGKKITDLSVSSAAYLGGVISYCNDVKQRILDVSEEDLDALKKLCAGGTVAAVLIECIQGEGGVNVLTQDFIDAVKEIAKQEDLLILDDEVQTGNGRTGALYAYMHYGFTPDVVTTAKGLGGGLPIGAVMLGEKTADLFHPGDNGSTFGGNPAVCAGALANLKRLDETRMNEVNRKSQLIFETLNEKPNVRSISGKGLMIGIEPEKGTAVDIAKKCLTKGVLVLTAGGNRVRLLPPLNISEENLQKALDVILAAFEDEGKE